MTLWMKLGIAAGGLFVLKLWNDSEKINAAIKAKASVPPAVNFVGGHTLPNPVNGSGTGGTVTTTDVPVSNSNTSVDYGRTYLDLAEVV